MRGRPSNARLFCEIQTTKSVEILTRNIWQQVYKEHNKSCLPHGADFTTRRNPGPQSPATGMAATQYTCAVTTLNQSNHLSM